MQRYANSVWYLSPRKKIPLSETPDPSDQISRLCAEDMLEKLGEQTIIPEAGHLEVLLVAFALAL